MKRFLMLVAVATVAGAMYVAAAPGSRQALPPSAKQFAALKKKVTTLSRSVNTLKKELGTVDKTVVGDDGFISGCLLTAGALPASQFGDSTSATYGFGYYAAPGATETFRTGLDIDVSAAPQGYLQIVDPSCVGSSPTSQAPGASGGGHLLVRPEQSR
jgi:hypothetical protein